MKLYTLYLFLFIVTVTGLTSDRTYAENPPRERKYYEAHQDIIWDKPMSRKWIALTFDDGPSSETTEEILTLLQKYQAKATFFCLGNKIKKYPMLAKSIVAQGHEIANHTYHHPIRQLSKAELDKEIEMTQRIIVETTGVKPLLFRPPGGIYNDTVVRAAKKQQLKVIMWSWDQDTKDWSNRRRKAAIVKKVIKNASNGDIVLFHDLKKKTVLSLEEILPELKKQGYQFVTVSQLLEVK
jgi:polysaccharide deacetylase family sporulation protein PdaB